MGKNWLKGVEWGPRQEERLSGPSDKVLPSRFCTGTIECEDLPVEDCAFAVSSSGARCVLEKVVKTNAAPQYKCQTSIIMAERPTEWIESEDCIKTCGLQRLSVGLSTDALLERDFTKRLCFSECRSKCPNINDLYTKLAAEEGMYLLTLCDSLKPRLRKLRGEQQRDQSVTQLSASTEATAKKTVVDIPSQSNEQSLQVQMPLVKSTEAAMTAGWPVVPPPPFYPVAEEPYPVVPEPPYYYAPSPTPIPTPAPAPAPYLIYSGYEPLPSPTPSPSPTPVPVPVPVPAPAPVTVPVPVPVPASVPVPVPVPVPAPHYYSA
ncbi:hypothetical protein L7F22_006383 [Adiantum nelumboides]|nr:hypothetical protein [Adiantum nelumboides]